MQFKAGDRVRIINSCSGCEAGKVYTLYDVSTNGRRDGDLWAWSEETDPRFGGCCCPNNRELVAEGLPDFPQTFNSFGPTTPEIMQNPTKYQCEFKQPSIMNNLINKVRGLARKEPEKSLIAKGITDTNDVLTSEGRELFIDYLYRTKKAEFVADPEVAALLAEQEK